VTQITEQINRTKIEPGFTSLSKFALETAGLVLVPEKSAMIRSRLRHRLNHLGVTSLDQYTDRVRQDTSGIEFQEMISALTTNVTGFFREPHHFDFLTEAKVNHLVDKLKSGEPVRVWSAGCSNGQEAYSLAMHLVEYDSNFANGNFKILATDIDTQVLHFANQGLYSEQQVSGVNKSYLEMYFAKAEQENSLAQYRLTKQIRNLITFKQLNLMDDWPMRGTFDVIFCRNVVIYFDAQTQAKLWKKFERVLDPDGLMFVGHSERISDHQFKSVGATVYAKSSSNAYSFQQTR